MRLEGPAVSSTGCSGRWLDPLWSAVAAIATYAVFSQREVSDTALAVLIVTAVSFVLTALELHSQSPRLTFPVTTFKSAVANAVLDWADNLIGIAALFAFWWLLWGEYGLPYYRPFWQAAALVMPIVPFVLFLGTLMTALSCKKPSRRPLTAALNGRTTPSVRAVLPDTLLALVVRAFFLPLNFCALVHGLSQFRGRESLLLTSTWPIQQATVLAMIYVALLAAITPGYLFGSRLLATHVRACDRTATGWIVTLSCYAPLSAPVFDRWLNYRWPYVQGDQPWATLLTGWPAASFTLGGAIICLELVHWWGEASFGLRASNLSNRGIIDTGPYRFCKHPIYLSKCVGWALIYLPFCGQGIEAVRSTLLFAGVCAIYVARSYTEERLLSSDPNYVRYAIWMDKYGAFSTLGQHFPHLTFEARYARWQRSKQRQPQTLPPLPE
jgi:hypothetical protein